MRRALLLLCAATLVLFPTPLKRDGFLMRDGFLSLKSDGFYIDCQVTVSLKPDGEETISCEK